MQVLDVFTLKHFITRRPSTEITYTGGLTSEGNSKQNLQSCCHHTACSRAFDTANSMSSAFNWSLGLASILANISVIMIMSSRGVLSLDKYPEKSATLTCSSKVGFKIEKSQQQQISLICGMSV